MRPDPHFSELIAEEWTARSRLTKALSNVPAAISAATLAALGVFAFYGFTVDDAWISARVAWRIANAFGHRFNESGPEVDAVTPLGWEYLLSLVAENGPLPAWQAARVIGVGAWLGAAAYLGLLVARAGTRRRRFAVFLLLPCAAPLGAWASAGMETGVVVALATFALGTQRRALLFAGLAAAWRPELVPWAVTLGLAQSVMRPADSDTQGGKVDPRLALRRAGVTLLLTLGPAVAVALTRSAWFGGGPPLAWIAKPPSLTHGARYALGALCFSAVPALVLATPKALWRLGGQSAALALASAVHLLALVLAGGDWMAFYRLAAPILPGLLLLGSRLADQSSWPPIAVRLTLGLAGGIALASGLGTAARGVAQHRSQLIEQAHPLLASVKRVAAVDVGWVGAATSASVFDLAGVTDPRVARLPGTHTSKQVTRALLESAPIDALVVLLRGREVRNPWWTSDFNYPVEQRIAGYFGEQGFESCGLLPLGGTDQAYLVLRRAPLPEECTPVVGR